MCYSLWCPLWEGAISFLPRFEWLAVWFYYNRRLKDSSYILCASYLLSCCKWQHLEPGAGERVQSVKCLLWKLEDMSSISSMPTKAGHSSTCTYDPRAEEADTEASLWLAGQSIWLSVRFQFSERPSLEHKMESYWGRYSTLTEAVTFTRTLTSDSVDQQFGLYVANLFCS